LASVYFCNGDFYVPTIQPRVTTTTTPQQTVAVFHARLYLMVYCVLCLIYSTNHKDC